MDQGCLVVYDIQHLGNRKPLPEAWRIFLDQFDVKEANSSKEKSMPGVTIDEKGNLGDLSLAMKGELVK
ncbi:hypothetical protein RND71_007104 [Anisodus tanguticus]|uniref:Uncharacterized protein n=1 Tax=Anisodus tanguticus TaxID=243964 RepID=A0AAE1SL79_9SOLA|nr:hypothetical protein RND71_007104 [Anisodus tanguticus]